MIGGKKMRLKEKNMTEIRKFAGLIEHERTNTAQQQVELCTCSWNSKNIGSIEESHRTNTVNLGR